MCGRRPRFSGELLDARVVVGTFARHQWRARAAAAAGATSTSVSAATARSRASLAGSGPVAAEPDLLGALGQRRVQDPETGNAPGIGLADRCRRGLRCG